MLGSFQVSIGESDMTTSLRFTSTIDVWDGTSLQIFLGVWEVKNSICVNVCLFLFGCSKHLEFDSDSGSQKSSYLPM